MTKRWIFTSVVAAAFAFSAGCSQMHKHEEEDEEANEVKMTLDQVPPPVRATLQQEAGTATIKSVDREQTKKGDTVYETDVMQGGKNWEIRVAPDGKLLSKKVDNEENEKSSSKEKEEDEANEHK